MRSSTKPGSTHRRSGALRGDEGLLSRKAVPHNHPNKTPQEVVDKVLHLRRTYHMGPQRIVWYLERYHGITTSDATVYRICRRHGLNRLPSCVGRRALHTHRYEKQVPGHHVQVDVKFLTLKRPRGAAVRRYQYTAIDAFLDESTPNARYGFWRQLETRCDVHTRFTGRAQENYARTANQPGWLCRPPYERRKCPPLPLRDFDLIRGTHFHGRSDS